MPKTGAKTDQLDWGDLRVALALARSGSVRKAARSLGVSHSTVLRRIRQLEQAAGVQLFLNKGDGYEPTAAGQDVFDTACELEETVLGLERRVAGRDQSLSGRVQVTFPDPFAPLLMPAITGIARAHPGIQIGLSLGTGYLDLAHRVADLAVRTTASPPPDLVGRHVATAAVGVYGSARYLDEHRTDDLEALDWVGWEEGSSMYFARWMAEQVPGARIALRVSAAWAFREALDADTGVAILPCALGELRPDWRRVTLVPEAATPLWVLTHQDLRRTARVSVVREALVEVIKANSDLIEGRVQALPNANKS
ncbi:MAG: LysR family transcriptional regulator [Gammaproteobacteria bacterium]|jgi:DNA-binding transcriptional LysR family regulator